MTPRFQPPPPDISPLIRFVREREAIRLRRERGEPPPWTDDPILNTYRFTNIRRRDDRVSQWIRAHVYLPFNAAALDPVLGHKFLMFSALCRWINWPPTILHLLTKHWYGDPGALNWYAMGQYIDRLEGKKWTSAYMIRADNTRPGRSKGSFICEDVIGASAERFRKLEFGPSRELVWKQLREFPNFGDFMAGQVVDDWTWSPTLLSRAVDHYTWAPMGPGSIRGFNRLLGRPLKQKPGKDEWNPILQSWREEVVEVLGEGYIDFTLMDQQNCLCEYDKYERVRMDGGRPRSRYAPHTY